MDLFNVGFTGTQEGMTEEQKATLYTLLSNLEQFDEFHHGDCVGSDAQAHEIAMELCMRRVIHPPIDPKKRAFCKGDVILPEKEYIERNHDIVDTTQWLIATPKEHHRVRRSGTWATVRYAESQRKDVAIIWPDGSVSGV